MRNEETCTTKISACALFPRSCCISCHDDVDYGYELGETRIGTIELVGCCTAREEAGKLSEADILALYRKINDE